MPAPRAVGADILIAMPLVATLVASLIGCKPENQAATTPAQPRTGGQAALVQASPKPAASGAAIVGNPFSGGNGVVTQVIAGFGANGVIDLNAAVPSGGAPPTT